jgi:hypothetical protein
MGRTLLDDALETAARDRQRKREREEEVLLAKLKAHNDYIDSLVRLNDDQLRVRGVYVPKRKKQQRRK